MAPITRQGLAARRRGLLSRGDPPDEPENLRDHLKAFLAFLELNRNVSPHTVRAYDSDVAQYLAWRAADCGRKISQLQTADLDGASMRAWMASLNRAGQARTTVARKLSGVRAFVHYLRREDVIDGDPTLAAVAPKLDKTIPVHLSEIEITALLEAIDVGTPLGRAGAVVLDFPDTGEIGPAVDGLRGGCGEVRFSARRSRHACRRIGEPLGINQGRRRGERTCGKNRQQWAEAATSREQPAGHDGEAS